MVVVVGDDGGERQQATRRSRNSQQQPPKLSGATRPTTARADELSEQQQADPASTRAGDLWAALL